MYGKVAYERGYVINAGICIELIGWMTMVDCRLIQLGDDVVGAFITEIGIC